MPAKNSRKSYQTNSYYHIYNRGVEKRDIFSETRDYKIFLSYLRTYLLPNVSNLQGLASQVRSPSKKLRNFAGNVDLVAYCLMPNHFHLLLYQHEPDAISRFMQAVVTKYVQQFNHHYHRVGSLFQGRYKGVLIDSENQLLYVTKYIHRNCLDLFPGKLPKQVLTTYPFSSYPNYLGRFSQLWLKPDSILSYFSTRNFALSYQAFVEESSDLSPSVTEWAIDADR